MQGLAGHLANNRAFDSYPTGGYALHSRWEKKEGQTQGDDQLSGRMELGARHKISERQATLAFPDNALCADMHEVHNEFLKLAYK